MTVTQPAAPANPLVAFLLHLQWSDPAVVLLKFLNAIVTGRQTQEPCVPPPQVNLRSPPCVTNRLGLVHVARTYTRYALESLVGCLWGVCPWKLIPFSEVQLPQLDAAFCAKCLVPEMRG